MCFDACAEVEEVKICCRCNEPCGIVAKYEEKDKTRPVCMRCYQLVYRAPKHKCCRCGRQGSVGKWTEAGPVCEKCNKKEWKRSYRQPLKKCDGCGETREIHVKTEEGSFCNKCRQQKFKSPKRHCYRCKRRRVAAKRTRHGYVCKACFDREKGYAAKRRE